MARNIYGFLLAVFLFVGVHGSQRLDSFTIDKSAISVSGMSSGAAMAIQMHVGYSATIMGVGSIAGIPYHCSAGDLNTGLTTCTTTPTDINVTKLTSFAEKEGTKGDIDPTDNIRQSRVFIWAGLDDGVINAVVSRKIESFYEDFTDTSNIMATYAPKAVHTFPTENYGDSCSHFGSPFIGNCNYNGAFELLNFIHGKLHRPTAKTVTKGKLIEFDQSEFLPSSNGKRFLMDSFINAELKAMELMAKAMGTAMTASAKFAASMFGVGQVTSSKSLDDVGYAYIPSGCFDSTVVCKLHIAFHGCKMQRELIGNVFAKHAGYNEVGELNNIIIVYPQTLSDSVSNPYGCWDWWGYTGSHYDTKKGFQMKAVKNMIDRLTGDLS